MGLSAFMKKLMFARQFTAGKGRIQAISIRLVSMAFVSLNEIQEEIINELGKKGIQIIYAAAKEGGYALAKQLCMSVGISGKEAVDMLMVGCSDLTGWGEFKLIDYKAEEGHAVFHIFDSPFKEVKSKSPQCHFARGLVAGSLRYIFNKEVDAVETKCISSGAEHCEFIVKPTGQFERNAKIVKEQLFPEEK